MAVTVKVDLIRTRKRIAWLDGVKTKARVPIYISTVGKILESGIRRYFERGAGPLGSWRPYSPATEKRKGTRRVTLRDTGALRRSMRLRLSPDGAKVVFTAPYAAFVQSARAFSGYSDELLAETRSAVHAAWRGTNQGRGPVGRGGRGPVGSGARGLVRSAAPRGPVR